MQQPMHDRLHVHLQLELAELYMSADRVTPAAQLFRCCHATGGTFHYPLALHEHLTGDAEPARTRPSPEKSIRESGDRDARTRREGTLTVVSD